MNETSGLRLRRQQKKISDIVRELDSFPKMSTDYKQYTGIGGLSTKYILLQIKWFGYITFLTLSIFFSFLVTLFMYLFMIWLILSEIIYYNASIIYNKFIPDVDFNDKLKITVDMTVAMQCNGKMLSC